jgi:hypothetical protein
VVGVAFNPAMEGASVFNDADALLDQLAELDMFAQIVPDAGERRRVLWDTPRRLFGLGEWKTGLAS